MHSCGMRTDHISSHLGEEGGVGGRLTATLLPLLIPVPLPSDQSHTTKPPDQTPIPIRPDTDPLTPQTKHTTPPCEQNDTRL